MLRKRLKSICFLIFLGCLCLSSYGKTKTGSLCVTSSSPVSGTTKFIIKKHKFNRAKQLAMTDKVIKNKYFLTEKEVRTLFRTVEEMLIRFGEEKIESRDLPDGVSLEAVQKEIKLTSLFLLEKVRSFKSRLLGEKDLFIEYRYLFRKMVLFELVEGSPEQQRFFYIQGLMLDSYKLLTRVVSDFTPYNGNFRNRIEVAKGGHGDISLIDIILAERFFSGGKHQEILSVFFQEGGSFRRSTDLASAFFTSKPLSYQSVVELSLLFLQNVHLSLDPVLVHDRWTNPYDNFFNHDIGGHLYVRSSEISDYLKKVGVNHHQSKSVFFSKPAQSSLRPWQDFVFQIYKNTLLIEDLNLSYFFHQQLNFLINEPRKKELTYHRDYFNWIKNSFREYQKEHKSLEYKDIHLMYKSIADHQLSPDRVFQLIKSYDLNHVVLQGVHRFGAAKVNLLKLRKLIRDIKRTSKEQFNMERLRYSREKNNEVNIILMAYHYQYFIPFLLENFQVFYGEN